MNKSGTVGTISELFDVLGGTASVARQLRVGSSTISEIKRRGRIPSEYWRELIMTARKNAHPEVTADLLVDLHARRLSPEPAGFAEEERGFDAAVIGGREDKTDKGLRQFSRFKHLRRPHFGSLEDVNAHVHALRDEGERR